MFLPADENFPSRGLLLKVALQTEHVVALNQHSRVDGAVRLMTGGATLAHRLVLKHERAPLRHVAFSTSVLLRGEGGPAADDRRSLVRIVAIAATDFPFEYRMMTGQSKTARDFQMALETSLW